MSRIGAKRSLSRNKASNSTGRTASGPAVSKKAISSLVRKSTTCSQTRARDALRREGLDTTHKMVLRQEIEAATLPKPNAPSKAPKPNVTATMLQFQGLMN